MGAGPPPTPGYWGLGVQLPQGGVVRKSFLGIQPTNGWAFSGLHRLEVEYFRFSDRGVAFMGLHPLVGGAFQGWPTGGVLPHGSTHRGQGFCLWGSNARLTPAFLRVP